MQKKLGEISKRGKGSLPEQSAPKEALHFSKQRREHREKIVKTKGYVASAAHEIMWSGHEEREALTRLSAFEKSCGLQVGQVDHGPPVDAMKFKALRKRQAPVRFGLP